LTFEKSLIFGGQQLEHPDWKRIPILDSEHQETYDFIPHIAYFYWLYILTKLEKRYAMIFLGGGGMCIMRYSSSQILD